MREVRDSSTARRPERSRLAQLAIVFFLGLFVMTTGLALLFKPRLGAVIGLSFLLVATLYRLCRHRYLALQKRVSRRSSAKRNPG